MNSSVDDIANQLKSLPSILSLEQELEIATQLKSCRVEELQDQSKVFARIVQVLYDSHIMNGVFEANEANLPVRQDIANWINDVSKLPRLITVKEQLISFAEVLVTPFR